MKAVIVMFDSLNRRVLPNYGGDWVHAPHFRRLAERTVTFDQSYICSMPCMPARRDFQTGRPNFLHRSWGPLEPFDDSVPELLRNAGIHSHLASDHPHYWEDGGGTYHPRYSTWDFSRGQEGDPWIGQVEAPELPPSEFGGSRNFLRTQDAINRPFTTHPDTFPLNLTFRNGLDYLRRNHEKDGWFLQIETFDPHEPFVSLPEHKAPYSTHYAAYHGMAADWPPYREVRESREVVEHARNEYAALVTACDQQLGKVLDAFDEFDLWKDTLLIVWTDHGFLLGEHESWAKCWTHFYNEIAHTPFFIWDPRSPDAAGQRRSALVQPSIDLGPTLLNWFGLPPTADMRGFDLAATIATDLPVRSHAIFGMFGKHVNLTDGRHVYFRGSADANNGPLFQYTLMPTHMRGRFTPEELSGGVELSPPLSFTKGCPVLKISARTTWSGSSLPTLLFDLKTDPGQLTPLNDPKLEAEMIRALTREMIRCEAPPEQFTRLDLIP